MSKGAKDADVDRLTREEIETWRKSFEQSYFGVIPEYVVARKQLNALCDMALQSLFQEAVRDEVLEEVLEEAARVCEGLIPKNAGTQFGQWRDEYDAYERCARHIRKCAKTLKREPNAALGMEHPNSAGAGPAPAAPVAEMVRQWEWPVNTVGKLITNLQTLPPDMSFYTAYFVEIDGTKVAKVSHPSLSRETVFNWRVQKYSPNEQSLIMWATPLPLAPGASDD